METSKNNPIYGFAPCWILPWLAALVFLMQPQLGWCQIPVIQSVLVHIPGSPDGGSWDTVIVDSLLSLNLRGVQPDIRVCVSSTHVPRTCTRQDCVDANWVPEGYVCQERLGQQGVLLEPNLHVEVLEIDPGSQQQVAVFNLPDPAACESSRPCKVDTPAGQLSISFEVVQQSSYHGPYQGVRGTVPNPPPHSTRPSNETPQEEASTSPVPPRPPVECNDADPEELRQPKEVVRTSEALKGRPFTNGDGDGCSIDSNDVKQGEAGNCFLLSALAAIATVSPCTIKNAIKVDPTDGTYSVALFLPDHGKLVRRLVAPLDNIFPAYVWGDRFLLRYWYKTPRTFLFAQAGDSQGDQSELWVMLFEKAYALTHGGYLSESFTNGAPSSYAMQTITGQPSEEWLVAPNPRELGVNAARSGLAISTVHQLHVTLSSLSREGKAITAGTISLCPEPKLSLWDQLLSSFPLSKPTLSEPRWVNKCGVPTKDFRCTTAQDPFFREAGGPLVRGHAYFVKKYADGIVTVGNPWGGELGKDVDLTLDEFSLTFRQLHINKPPATKPCSCDG